MNKPLLVGITGGIGSGKSTISRIFEILGIKVYYADDRGKDLMVEDKELKSKIVDAFGSESYQTNGILNRSFLAAQVFNDKAQLARLNSFVHPAVAKDFEFWTTNNNSEKYLLKEAALLYETGSYQTLDRTIVVDAPKVLRVERVLLRDLQRSVEEIENIISKQISDGKRRKLADYLIDNGGRSLVIPQVLKIHQNLLDLSSQGI